MPNETVLVVVSVRQQWAEKEDGCLAYDLQSKECAYTVMILVNI